jgi:uncharacterized coiled-coil protein SlyX
MEWDKLISLVQNPWSGLVAVLFIIAAWWARGGSDWWLKRGDQSAKQRLDKKKVDDDFLAATAQRQYDQIAGGFKTALDLMSIQRDRDVSRIAHLESHVDRQDKELDEVHKQLADCVEDRHKLHAQVDKLSAQISHLNGEPIQ